MLQQGERGEVLGVSPNDPWGPVANIFHRPPARVRARLIERPTHAIGGSCVSCASASSWPRLSVAARDPLATDSRHDAPIISGVTRTDAAVRWHPKSFGPVPITRPRGARSARRSGGRRSIRRR